VIKKLAMAVLVLAMSALGASFAPAGGNGAEAFEEDEGAGGDWQTETTNMQKATPAPGTDLRRHGAAGKNSGMEENGSRWR